MDNSAVIRRFGYLCDYFGVNIDLAKPKTRNYILLPSSPNLLQATGYRMARIPKSL